jgi:D-tyrosyl-tRNA(Tyr) deacylase
MKALIQRVRHASVRVGEREVGAIGPGLLALVGVERGDEEASADRLLHRMLHYRLFGDEAGRMNLDLRQVEGGLLLVSQFTLAADTRKGLRPSFSRAAPPDEGERLYHYLLDRARETWPHTQSGEFAADMQVSLLNDGPVTFLLES